MNISRFFGATNREAMRQVRLALGSEALIISNKRVNGGVEILATDATSLPEAAQPTDDAADVGAVYTPSAPSAAGLPPYRQSAAAAGYAASQNAAAPTRPVTPSAMPAGAPAAPTQAPASPAAAELAGALDELKGSLESRMDELLWGNQLRRSPQAITLFQGLLRFGFSTTLLRAMLKTLPELAGSRAAIQWARGELIRHLPVLASEADLWQPGLALALVGPTGVGKTTTIAKLAARCVRRNGPDSLVLLTTDTYRIGAHEQLKIYGQMLRVPVHVVQDVHELRRVLQTVRPDQTVLIDNVGISQRDRYVADQAALLAGAGRRVERLLALNASSHGDTLDEVARSYVRDGGTPLRGCIITKIDEASCLGGALDTAIRYRLPIHYVSNGQKVPENLLFLTAAELVDRALVPLQSVRTQFAPTEADLAALMSITQPEESAEAVAERRRQQVLLPQLLTQSARGDSLGLDQLRAAVALLDEDSILAEGYDLWHSRAAGQLPAAVGAIDHLRRVARMGLAEGEAALVVHDRQLLSWQGRRGAWCAAACFGGDARPLAATAQQAGLADGWYAVQGAQSVAPSALDVLHQQIALESEGLDSAPCHVFEGGSQALLRALSAEGRVWLSAISARARIYQDGEACVASAAAQRLAYQPLDGGLFASLRAPAGLDGAQLAWWAGQAPAELHLRGETALPVRLFCLRAVDPLDGRVVRVWHALQGMAGALAPGPLAMALVLRQECHAAWRLATPWLADAQGREPLLDRAVLAAQLGLAAWRLVQAPVLAPAAHAVARMLGSETLTARQSPAGLLKLYALKELLAV
ncbi:flagellar biosynthesis protein FlhF [Castellaniella caeni]|uniref:flagellar biosynthesis protein FlhF n=2 Tax=Castellaniella caeni TaxID=266123 RepID=UPI000832F90B|nr:flagellar biosynthesis protein FlhF [Castellaniella caeni]